ncbi:hypothetical protein BF49_7140 [Bradyrhizobium sp.]|uniref:FeoB-associated Cys-rich membrane protein n=1 Tax=Bradyrhizobium sp. TaxID=376 RepID=UPI0007C18FE7|nr:FeoB-associated Cys-rich membrane protein [Bradyrhizobium sp.]CUT12556.1 hypothetical protein BF49_3636 [Bradyrhizobium sp.]CUT16060.1 hypothetical protein BF49_7140 [Bradyrhizobium sp.]
MEEVLKALGPFPVAQGIVIGILVAAAGFWAIRKGLQDSRRGEGEVARTVRIEHSDEEKRWQWEAYKQLGHLEKNSFDQVKHSEDTVDLLREVLKGINRIADGRFNLRQ